MYKKTFTLAEVLITLTIIGVIAVITVPLVMANHKKTEYSAKLKKFYSQMNNAIKLAELDTGVYADEWAGGKATSAKDFFDTYLKNYLRTNMTKEDTGRYGNNYKVYLDDGTSMEIFPGGDMTVSVNVDDGSYVNQSCFDSCSDPSSYECFLECADSALPAVFFDLNGDKGPNEDGRDIFRFTIYGSALNTGYANAFDVQQSASNLSLGSREEIIESCKTDAYSGGCTLLLKNDGWEFKDDYPLRI